MLTKYLVVSSISLPIRPAEVLARKCNIILITLGQFNLQNIKRFGCVHPYAKYRLLLYLTSRLAYVTFQRFYSNVNSTLKPHIVSISYQPSFNLISTCLNVVSTQVQRFSNSYQPIYAQAHLYAVSIFYIKYLVSDSFVQR